MNKVCIKCGPPAQPEDNFHQNFQMVGGRRNACKECTRKDYAKWRALNPETSRRCSARWKSRNYESVQEYAATWKIENPEVHRRLNARWAARNPEKVKAHLAVYHAVLDGRLFKKPCHCGTVEVEAHHENYTKPLEVVWLCKQHHTKADERRRERETA